MDSPRIVVVGSANIDLVTRVARAPRPGESMVGLGFKTVTGGKGANQAIAAARLGAQVLFCGCVGADVFGTQQRDALADAGVNTQHLKMHPLEPTGTAVILVADGGENSIVVTPSANYCLSPIDIAGLEEDIANADALLTQLEIPQETVEAALALARQHGVLSVLDCGPAQRVPASLLALADVVSPNETEAETMLGRRIDSIEDAKAAAAALRDISGGHVVLKLGARGALYAGPGALHLQPAFAVDAVDTTAAGDAFTAALAIGLRALPPLEALRFANAAGALAVTREGAQPSMPARAEVEAMLSLNLE